MRHLLLILIAWTMTSCVTTTKPQAPTYQPPTGDSADLATISGSVIPTKFFIFDDYHTYVYSVDGNPIRAKKKNREHPISLLPGERSITAGFEQGVYYAFARINFIAAVRGQYQVKSSCPSKPIGNPFTYCDFWVINSLTQSSVSPVSRANVRGGVTMLIIP
jgi:hypothetical protein